MLPTEVMRAVREGKFSVWAASDVASSLELLSGMPTGENEHTILAHDKGKESFPPGTLYAAVASRLRAFSAAMSKV